MRILVTGGAGFIGRYVVDRLKIMGHVVKVLDIGKVWPSDIHVLPDVIAPGSITDSVKINNLVKHIDVVMNLAGLLGTSETIEEPIKPIKVNIIGALNVYNACRKHNKRCCTITVGNHFMQNTYAITKSCAERFALMYNKEHGTKIAVVRGLNAYGPGQKHKPVRKVIPNFVIPAIKNEPITIYGDGSQIMDFIYVEDLATILCSALLDDHNCYDKIIEAGSGRETSIQYIADKVRTLAESTSPINYKPMRPGEIEKSTVVADTNTMQPLGVDVENLTSLATGLTATIEYYRNHIKDYD